MSNGASQIPSGPIGRGYVCRSLIGTGGMGEVYLADDPETGQRVALKLIRADRADHVRALRRFTREVRAMARLDHPNIASVYDYGVHTDEVGVARPYFVMEHIDGPSLRDFLTSQPSLEEALPIFDEMLAALAYAHARGVIHRDLKPENVLLRRNEHGRPAHPKLLDFGIARMVDDDALDEATVARIELDMSDNIGRGITDEMSTLEMGVHMVGEVSEILSVVSSSSPGVAGVSETGPLAGAPDDDDHDLDPELDDLDDVELEDDGARGSCSTIDDVPPPVAGRLTQINQCVGTPAYLAPEQIRARRHGVGPASDLYAIGIMLYELVCGERPFRARTPRELLKMHLVKPVPAISPRRGLQVPEGLPPLIARLLRKSPHERLEFAADVRRQLRAVVSGREVVPPALVGLEAVSDGPVVAGNNGATPSSPLNPALARPGTSSLGERSARLRDGSGSGPRPAPTARLAMGLVQFREAAFFGRGHERQALWQRFTDAHDTGSTQVVIVDGEAGIGKTRLVRWLRERAEEIGLARTFVAPFSAGAGGAGLRVTLERHLVCKGLEGDALRTRVREELKRLDLREPWMENAICSFLRPGRSDGTLMQAVPTLSTTFALADTILRRFAAERPIILHLDDAQAVPDEALELVEFLLGQQSTTPYPSLIVACIRSEDLLTQPLLRNRISRLAGHPAVSRMTLEPLERSDVLRLVNSLLPLDRPTAAMLANRAAGHPQFAVQLLHHWVEGKELQPGDDGRVLGRVHDQPVPTRINEVVERRVSKFLESIGRHGHSSDLAQSVLGWMAIIGEPVQFGLLVELARTESISPEQVAIIWESALIDGLCVEDPHDETLHFGHAVIRAQMLEWARSQAGYLARQAACADAKLRVAGRDPVQLNYEVSAHLFEAGEPSRAWRHLVFSARCSLDLNQFRLAWRRLRRALEIASGQTPMPRRTRSGEGDASEVLQVARPSSGIEVGASERFDARRAYIEACIRMNHLDELDLELAALQIEAGHDPARHGWTAVLEADVVARRGEVERAIELYRNALACFDDVGHDESTARALRGLGDTLSRSGRIPAGLDALQRAEPIARRNGNDNLLAEILLSAGATHFDNGDHDASARCLQEALHVFAAGSNLAGVGETHVQLGRAHLTVGDLDTARAHFSAARRAHTLIGDRHGVVRALNGFGEVARLRGDLAEAELSYLQALELIESAPGVEENESDTIVRANLGLVQLERGHTRDARATLVATARTLRRLGTRPTEVIVYGLLAATEAAMGNFAGCEGWLDCIANAELQRPPADRDYADQLLGAARRALRAGEHRLTRLLLQHAWAAYELLGDEEQLARVEETLRGLTTVAL